MIMKYIKYEWKYFVETNLKELTNKELIKLIETVEEVKTWHEECYNMYLHSWPIMNNEIEPNTKRTPSPPVYLWFWYAPF